jgi:hypothetical protein
MNLILVYAGTHTIFANFRTFIRLYLIIFHCYIALYVATLCRTSMLHLCHITTMCLTPLDHHCLMSLHVTSQVIRPSQAVRLTTP